MWDVRFRIADFGLRIDEGCRVQGARHKVGLDVIFFLAPLALSRVPLWLPATDYLSFYDFNVLNDFNDLNALNN